LFFAFFFVRRMLTYFRQNIFCLESPYLILTRRTCKLEKCQLENQMTGLSLKRGALEDQTNHLGLEVQELKERF
jgi:hypothetical protein